MKNQKLTLEQKGKIINQIIGQMKINQLTYKKHIDFGDMFFSLAFKSDKELIKIYNLV